MHMIDRSQYAPRPMVVFATDILVGNHVKQRFGAGRRLFMVMCTAVREHCRAPHSPIVERCACIMREVPLRPYATPIKGGAAP